MNEFYRYFASFSSDVNAVELDCMIRRLNKDKLSGRVSLPEFIDELEPKCKDKRY